MRVGPRGAHPHSPAPLLLPQRGQGQEEGDTAPRCLSVTICAHGFVWCTIHRLRLAMEVVEGALQRSLTPPVRPEIHMNRGDPDSLSCLTVQLVYRKV